MKKWSLNKKTNMLFLGVALLCVLGAYAIEFVK